MNTVYDNPDGINSENSNSNTTLEHPNLIASNHQIPETKNNQATETNNRQSTEVNNNQTAETNNYQSTEANNRPASTTESLYVHEVNGKLTDSVNKSRIKSRFRHYYFGSFVYALFFTFCLYQNFNGITYPFFVGGTLYFFYSCMKKFGITAKKDSLFYVISLLLLGVSTFCTDSEPLIFMNTLGVLLLGFSFALHSFYDDRSWSFGKHFSSIVSLCFGAFSCLDRPFRDLAWYQRIKTPGEKNKKLMAVLFGVVIAIPLLTVVTLLLYHADSIFASFFDRFFADLKNIPEDAFGITFTFLFAFFAYYCIWTFLCRKKIKEAVTDKRTEPLIGITFTGLVLLVYLAFCFIQVRYLFLGKIPMTKEFTYAEYARAGFFQLLFVCLINLGMVLICLRRFHDHRVLKTILTAITACTFIMIASSVMRMLLYIMYYNLTFLRVMVLWALFIILILMIGVLVTIYKPTFPLFRFGTVTVTVIYLLFSFSHPDYWIARYNIVPHTYVIEHLGIEATPEIDYYYLVALSTDAAPVLLTDPRGFSEVQPPSQVRKNECRQFYLNRINDSIKNNRSFRTFNLSRFIASRLLP